MGNCKLVKHWWWRDKCEGDCAEEMSCMVTRTRSYFLFWEQAAECGCGRRATDAEHESMSTDFPDLPQGGYYVTGEATKDYNCFGWGLCSSVYGPHEPKPEQLGKPDAMLGWFDKMYGAAGWKRSTNCNPERGKRKVALYCKADGTPTHAAKQRHGDQWESKLGINVRIVHTGTGALEGPKYGKVCRCYEMSLKDLVKKIRELIEEIDGFLANGPDAKLEQAKREAQEAFDRLEADLAKEGSK